jgi:hypothetical protein
MLTRQKFEYTVITNHRTGTSTERKGFLLTDVEYRLIERHLNEGSSVKKEFENISGKEGIDVKLVREYLDQPSEF